MQRFYDQSNVVKNLGLTVFLEELARTLVSPVRSKLSISIDKPTKSPICGAYQAGNCTQAGDHFGSYGDKKLLHVCRKCVLKCKDPTDYGFDILQRIADLDKN